MVAIPTKPVPDFEQGHRQGYENSSGSTRKLTIQNTSTDIYISCIQLIILLRLLYRIYFLSIDTLKTRVEITTARSQFSFCFNN